jgi:hypothetical protein
MPDPSTAGRFEADRLTFDWTREGGRLAYVLRVVVPDACHRAGAQEHGQVGADTLRIAVTVDYRPGMCLQALQTLSFRDEVPVPGAVRSIRLDVLDARSGTTTEHVIDLR